MVLEILEAVSLSSGTVNGVTNSDNVKVPWYVKWIDDLEKLTELIVLDEFEGTERYVVSVCEGERCGWDK